MTPSRHTRSSKKGGALLPTPVFLSLPHELMDEVANALDSPSLIALAASCRPLRKRYGARALVALLAPHLKKTVFCLADPEVEVDPFVITSAEIVKGGARGGERVTIQLVYPEFTRFEKAMETHDYIFVRRAGERLSMAPSYTRSYLRGPQTSERFSPLERDQWADEEQGRITTMDCDGKFRALLTLATLDLLNERFLCPECQGTKVVLAGSADVARRWRRLEQQTPEFKVACPRCRDTYDGAVFDRDFFFLEYRMENGLLTEEDISGMMAEPDDGYSSDNLALMECG